MGLLDQVLGSVLGAGQGSARAPQQGSLASSPTAKALLGVLAAKAYKHYTSRPQEETERLPDEPGTGPSRRLPEEPAGQSPGGALGGGLGGLLGGLAGAGGLQALIEQFRQRGQGDVIDSWVGRGENRRIAPNQLEDALGPEAIDELQERTGMSRDNMLAELSKLLPEAVDQVTPDGRVPTREELSRWA